MSTTTVAEHELTIPARFVALVRLAVIDLVSNDADWVKDQTAELAKVYQDEDQGPAAVDGRLADLDGAKRSLSEAYQLLERFGARRPARGRDDPGTFEGLHGALEQVIGVAAKDMVDAGAYSPIDGAEIMHRSAAAIWAVENSNRSAAPMG